MGAKWRWCNIRSVVWRTDCTWYRMTQKKSFATRLRHPWRQRISMQNTRRPFLRGVDSHNIRFSSRSPWGSIGWMKALLAGGPMQCKYRNSAAQPHALFGQIHCSKSSYVLQMCLKNEEQENLIIIFPHLMPWITHNNVPRVVVTSFGLMQKPSNLFFVPAPFSHFVPESLFFFVPVCHI
jgi:hypothetical protein